MSAPAGYGKTTFLAEFARDAQFPVCWLSLDPSDRDLAAFSQHLLAALQRQFPGAGDRSQQQLDTPSLTPLVAATTLLEQMEETATEFFVVVLDDYHEVDDAEPVNQVVDRLLADAPEHCRFIIASRTIPGRLRLSRLAAQDQAAGVGATELAFTTGEVAELLRVQGRGNVTQEEARRWELACHGWAAALVLTQEIASPEDAAAHRSPRQLFAYLTEEVVGSLPAPLPAFLLQTAVLDPVTPAMADALLGGAGADTLLADLASRLLFVRRLDEEPVAYGYHPLLREYLLTRLRTEQHDLHSTLRARAGNLAESAGHMETAIDQYLQGGHYSAAAGVLEESSSDFMRQGRWVALRDWLQALPAGQIDVRPRLLIAMTRVLQRIGETDNAAHYGHRAVAQARVTKDVRLISEALLALARVLGPSGQFKEADDVAREVLGLLRSDEDALRSDAHEIRGICLRHLGKTVQGIAELQHAHRHALETGDAVRQAQVERSLASVYLATDALEQAEVHYRAAFTLWQQQRDLPLQAAALNGLALVESRRGDYNESLQHFHQAYQLALAAHTHPHLEGMILRNMADDLRDLRRYEEARNTLVQAEELAKQCGDNWLKAGVLVSTAEVLRASGQLLEAERAATGAQRWAKHIDSPQYAGLAAGARAAIALERGELESANRHLAAAVRALRRAHTNRELALVMFRSMLVAVAQQHAGLAAGHASAVFELAGDTEMGLSLVAAGAEFIAPLRTAVGQGIGGEALHGLLQRSEEWLRRHQPAPTVAPAVAKPVPAAGPRLQAFAFGPGEVLCNAAPVTGHQWGTAIARELFFLLALHPNGMRREQIVTALWPETSAGRAVTQFHSTLHRMRRALALATLPHEGGRYRLDPKLAVWSDVAEFEHLIKGAAVPDLSQAEAIGLLEGAVELYRGGFLEECYAEWAQAPREKLEARYLRALMALARVYDERGDYDRSIEYYERVLRVDNTLEDVHSRILRCYAEKGEPALVREHYQRYTEWLARELGATPSNRLARNFRELVHDEV